MLSWQISQSKAEKREKKKKTEQNKTKKKKKENDGKIWVIRMMAKIRPP